MVKTVLICLSVILLAGCTPAPSAPDAVGTEIAEARAAIQTAASIAVPTDTLAPTLLPKPTEVPTSSPTAAVTQAAAAEDQTHTPTPDQRVIDADPRSFLLKAEDLPGDLGYHLPNEAWMGHHPNSEILSNWGAREGRQYLEATGRVDGWWVVYARGSSLTTGPEEIYHLAAMYRTAQGARLVIGEYSSCRRSPDSGYRIIETSYVLGDGSVVCRWEEIQPDGTNRVEYMLEFTHRNYYHTVSGWGDESEVRLEFLVQVARTLLVNLELAPLSDAVMFEP
jgi:hypothetical protein